MDWHLINFNTWSWRILGVQIYSFTSFGERLTVYQISAFCVLWYFDRDSGEKTEILKQVLIKPMVLNPCSGKPLQVFSQKIKYTIKNCCERKFNKMWNHFCMWMLIRPGGFCIIRTFHNQQVLPGWPPLVVSVPRKKNVTSLVFPDF